MRRLTAMAAICWLVGLCLPFDCQGFGAVIQRGAQGEARTLIGHVFNDREQTAAKGNCLS